MTHTITWITKNVKFLENQFRIAVDDAIEEYSREIIKDLEGSTATWTHQPKFTYSRRERNVKTNSKRFLWVSGGTRVRYAKLSKDWQSKSQPGSLRAYPGAGKVVARGKKAPAAPGIKARNFVELSLAHRWNELGPKVKSHIKKRAYKIFQ